MARPTQQINVLTDEQAQLFQEMLAWYGATRGRKGLHGQREAIVDQPWTWTVLTPPGGIPALQEDYNGTGTGSHEGDSPGYADCEVFVKWDTTETGTRLVKPLLRSMGFDITVHNAGSAVDGDKYIEAERDLEGVWWVGGSGGGDSGCVPDVEAITDVSQTGGDCGSAVLEFTRKQFNCDGTTTTLTPQEVSVDIQTRSVQVVTNVGVTGVCSGTSITLTVTLTKANITTIDCGGDGTGT